MANTDKFLNAEALWSGTLGTGGIADDSVDTFSLASATGLTDGETYAFTIDRVDLNGTKTLSKREVIIGVLSGTDVIDCLRGQEGTAQAHSAGAVVEILFTAKQWKRLREGLVAEHNQDGTHQILTYASLIAPEGFLINGKIVPSVDSNNLTVALKTLSGDDASATNPIYVRIGDTIRTISAALSTTLNAGTNWFNAGSAELATKEIDYFVYLGDRAGTVRLGFGRIPYAERQNDYSATNTDSRHIAFSSALSSDDKVNVIGRFAATLSAGAGYTWSVPTFTATNLIQRPIYGTRWLSYVSTPVAGGGTAASFSGMRSMYCIQRNTCVVNINLTNSSGGTAGSGGVLTLKTPLIYTTTTTEASSVGNLICRNGSTYNIRGTERAGNDEIWVGAPALGAESWTLLNDANDRAIWGTINLPLK
jgi:hypothetical protein